MKDSQIRKDVRYLNAIGGAAKMGRAGVRSLKQGLPMAATIAFHNAEGLSREAFNVYERLAAEPEESSE